MLVSKKRVRRLPHVVASSVVPTFYATDGRSKTKFLVDTGASKSLLPRSFRASPGVTGESMRAANDSLIQTYGTRDLRVTFDGVEYTWTFTVADVFAPILGADFLETHNLLVDVRHRRLVPSSIAAVTSNDEVNKVLSRHAAVFAESLAARPHRIHEIQHFIQTTGPPVFARPRRLAPEKLRAAKKCFQEMEAQGICQKASSPWASPLHLVKKGDGSFRPCGDYRRLNIATVPDRYPLPNINDITSYLEGAAVFSKIDLLKGYFQLPMNKEDIQKTAITTPFGTYTFNYACFGLKNSGATFQRLMDSLFRDLPFVVVYVDDILIYSRNMKEHLDHLDQVLKILEENGLVAKSDKCTFAATEVSFLGHTVSAKGLAVSNTKVQAIKDFAKPLVTKGLREFLGMITYYQRFLPGIAKTLAPLTNLLKGNPKPKNKLSWSSATNAAFEDAKRQLQRATLLAFPSTHGALRLTTDASDVAIGAALEQLLDDTAKPISFFSRKLSPTEQRYSTFDRELLAIHDACRHFHHMIEGQEFTILTDHKPLVHAISKKTDPISARQRRQLSAIAEYNCNLQHVAGNDNTVADALSRSTIATAELSLDIAELQRLQKQEEQTARADNSLKLEFIEDNMGRSILCDTSTSQPRPWIPVSLRKEAFNIIHNLAHPSRKSTAAILSKRYVWPGIKKDAKHWARACLQCQTSKVTRHVDTGVGKFDQPSRRFGHIHVDIVGPLPSSQSHRYLFTIIDRSTRWPEAVPMKNTQTADCVTALLNGWISRFGIPNIITSDRGAQFTSALWQDLAKRLGIQTTNTTAYHPESNGMIERFHRTLKAALMASCERSDWLSQLPWTLLGLRTTPKDEYLASAADMVYGEPLSVPGDFFSEKGLSNSEEIYNKVMKFIPVKQTFHEKRNKAVYVPLDIKQCKFAFVRNDAISPPLTRPYSGPYEILKRKEKIYQLKINCKPVWISLDRLKPAFSLEHNKENLGGVI